MTDKLQDDKVLAGVQPRDPENSERPAPSDSAREDADNVAAAQLPRKPAAPARFSVVQYNLTVPKPSYHRYLNDQPVNESPEDEGGQHDDDAEATDKDGLTAEQMRASKRVNARRYRVIGFFLLVILIYGVMRTVRLMH